MNPVLALIITNTIWGGAAPIFKLALTNIPPFTLAFMRFFLASFLLLPFIWGVRQKLTKRDWIEISLIGFFSIGLNISLFFLGLQRTESINASVIATAAPVFLYFSSIIFLHEKPHPKVLSGMMLALFGVFVVILSPIFLDSKSVAVGEIEGNLMYLVATMSLMVIAPLIGKDLLKRVNPLLVTYMSFVIGSLFFVPFMLVELQSWSFTQLNGNGWLGIIYGIFFSSAIAYFLYNYGISRIKGQEIGVFNYIDPVVTVILAAPLLGEYPNAYYLVGALLVFVGIFIAEGRIHWHPIHKLKARA